MSGRIAGLAIVLALGAAQAQAQVNVTITGEVRPGVYGRVSIGGAPPPVFYPEPVLIVQSRRPPQPIYMHVPPGHAKNWSKHCGKYNACGAPVYFVKSAEYEPGYQHPGKGHAKGHGKGHGKGG